MSMSIVTMQDAINAAFESKYPSPRPLPDDMLLFIEAIATGVYNEIVANAQDSVGGPVT